MFGKTGAFKGEDITKLCLDKPACANFVVMKLYRYFISESDAPAGMAGRWIQVTHGRHALAPSSYLLRAIPIDASYHRGATRSARFTDVRARRRHG